MFNNHFIHYVFLLTFLWCNVVFANETEVNTTAASGGEQIVVSPINILLNIGESGSADVLVLDKDGNPVEDRKLQIIPQDKTKITVSSDSFITNESGYVQFSILGKRQGDTVVTVSDGAISFEVNVAIRNFIHYALPYFYGNMQLSFINPSEDINYVKIQFHESGDRLMPPVITRLEGKEMKVVKLSEEMDVTLKDGWVEVFSTEIIFGGTWTNKGYLPLRRIDE